MSSSFWQLGVESRDFSQDEKERTAKLQNDNYFHSKRQPRTIFSKKLLSFCEFAQLCKQFFPSQHEKNYVTPNSQKVEEM